MFRSKKKEEEIEFIVENHSASPLDVFIDPPVDSYKIDKGSSVIFKVIGGT